MMEEKKIIFVCTGNTCRSPMAEAVLRSELKRLNIGDVSVFSAGLEPSKNGNINPHSAAVLSENGLSIENFASRALDEEMLTNAYAVICMTDSQRDILMDMRWNLLRRTGLSEIENNVYSFSDIAGYEIPDPFGRDKECYRLTYTKIAGGMAAIIAKLFPELSAEESAQAAEKEKQENPVREKEREATVKPRKPRAKPRKRVARSGTERMSSAKKSTAKKASAKMKAAKKSSASVVFAEKEKKSKD